MPRFAGSTCCRTWKRFGQTEDERPPRATRSQNLKEEQKDCDLRIGAGRTRGEPVAAGVQNGHQNLPLSVASRLETVSGEVIPAV